jgi:hypothetical protein
MRSALASARSDFRPDLRHGQARWVATTATGPRHRAAAVVMAIYLMEPIPLPERLPSKASAQKSAVDSFSVDRNELGGNLID